jgi:hypothetical protein
LALGFSGFSEESGLFEGCFEGCFAFGLEDAEARFVASDLAGDAVFIEGGEGKFPKASRCSSARVSLLRTAN